MVSTIYKLAPLSETPKFARMYLSCGRLGPASVMTNLHGLRILSEKEEIQVRPKHKPGKGSMKILEVVQVGRERRSSFTGML